MDCSLHRAHFSYVSIKYSLKQIVQIAKLGLYLIVHCIPKSLAVGQESHCPTKYLNPIILQKETDRCYRNNTIRKPLTPEFSVWPKFIPENVFYSLEVYLFLKLQKEILIYRELKSDSVLGSPLNKHIHLPREDNVHDISCIAHSGGFEKASKIIPQCWMQTLKMNLKINSEP